MRHSVNSMAAGVVVMALVLCGCGGSDEKAPGDVLLELLHAKLDKGEYDTVIESSTEALKLSPDHRAPLLMIRGIAWLRKRDYDIAAKDFDEALALAPSSSELHMYRAESKAGNGRHDDAIEDCNAAIRIKPTNAKAFVIRGTSWRQKGQEEKAVADFKRAFELEPSLFKAVE
jgi:tetratricopeptide (TPR) repeat protein